MTIIKRTEKINIELFVLKGNPLKQECLLMQKNALDAIRSHILI